MGVLLFSRPALRNYTLRFCTFQIKHKWPEEKQFTFTAPTNPASIKSLMLKKQNLMWCYQQTFKNQQENIKFPQRETPWRFSKKFTSSGKVVARSCNQNAQDCLKKLAVHFSLHSFDVEVPEEGR